MDRRGRTSLAGTTPACNRPDHSRHGPNDKERCRAIRPGIRGQLGSRQASGALRRLWPGIQPVQRATWNLGDDTCPRLNWPRLACGNRFLRQPGVLAPLPEPGRRPARPRTRLANGDSDPRTYGLKAVCCRCLLRQSLQTSRPGRGLAQQGSADTASIPVGEGGHSSAPEPAHPKKRR